VTTLTYGMIDPGREVAGASRESPQGGSLAWPVAEPDLSAGAPLRVLMVTARFLPHLGGTEIHTYELARRLVARGVDVTVLTTELDPTQLSSDSRYGVPAVRMKAWPKGRDWYVAPDIRRVVGSGRWDLVHVQGIHTMVLPIALGAARRAGVPYIITLHSGGHSSRIRRLTRQLAWWALGHWIRDAAWIIAVSEFERDIFSALLGLPDRRLEIIPSGVEPSTSQSALSGEPESVRPDPDTPLIVSVGRLEEYKGHDRILRALPGVAAHFPGVRLVILGSGPDEQRLRRIAAELRVPGRVEFLAIPVERRAELHALLDRADLVVALSAYESQGLAAMEAAAHGCSVLVAESSALQELVAAGLARGIRPGSTGQLAAAVVAQLRDPHRPTGELPTWDACATMTHELYLSAIRRRAPSKRV
jgi:glycosyltransferase involved in cell wall biosynthesis